MSDPNGYELRSRSELIEEARRAGVERPERMTRAELRDEILRLTRPAAEQAEARGLFGVARSMLASVVESGLHLPDAARLIRGTETLDSTVRNRTPVATVTLAEIYAAQGHKKRALRMLEEVLTQEPDHEVALRLRRELTESSSPEATTALSTELAPGFVETTGIEVKTGQPPEAAPVPSSVDDGPASGGEGASVEPPVVPPRETSPDGPAVVLERGESLRLYWEFAQGDLETTGFDLHDSRPALRVVAFVAQRGAPVQTERTFPIEIAAARGVLCVDDFSASDQVRAAVGVIVEGAFVPLAVARTHDEIRERRPGLAARATSALSAV